MAGQSWSINITGSAGQVQFTPDIFNAQPGAPLQAQNGDIVSWNNQTNDPHTLAVDTGAGGTNEKLSVGPWSSTTGYVIQKGTRTPPFTVSYNDETGTTGTINVIS